MTRRWQDDQDFVRFLDRMGYLVLDEDGKTIEQVYLSAGLYLYMWEAWCSRAALLEEQPDTVEMPTVNSGESDAD